MKKIVMAVAPSSPAGLQREPGLFSRPAQGRYSATARASLCPSSVAFITLCCHMRMCAASLLTAFHVTAAAIAHRKHASLRVKKSWPCHKKVLNKSEGLYSDKSGICGNAPAPSAARCRTSLGSLAYPSPGMTWGESGLVEQTGEPLRHIRGRNDSS